MLNFIIGFLSPLVIAVINRPFWSNGVKVAITVGFSVIVGFLTVYLSGELSAADVTQSILVTLVASITAYNGIFKPTGIAAKITLATSPEKKLFKSDMSG